MRVLVVRNWDKTHRLNFQMQWLDNENKNRITKTGGKKIFKTAGPEKAHFVLLIYMGFEGLRLKALTGINYKFTVKHLNVPTLASVKFKFYSKETKLQIAESMVFKD
jgi:hypothetical protein